MSIQNFFLERVPQFVIRAANIKIILIVFALLGVAYSLATPVFEAPDEMNHFAYVKGLVDGRGFPSAPAIRADNLPAQESSQPPIYYLTAAFVVRLLAPETSDFEQLLVHNPAFPEINSDIPIDNKNQFIHTLPGGWVNAGTTRAVHVARWVALAFGLLTVWATYRLGREISPARLELALLAASFVAFTPQFIFISSSINNDSAVAATSALSLWATARIMRFGYTPRRSLALGLALGSATLSKISALVLGPLALCATLLIDAAAVLNWKRRLRYSLLTFVIMLAVSSLWLIHSWGTFGDPLGTSTHLITFSARPVPISISAALSQLSGSFISYWLAFGWTTILAPEWVYALFGLISVVGLGGTLAWGIRQWPARQYPEIRLELATLAMLAAALLATFIALVRWLQLHDASLGRLMFPVISAIGVLLANGWLFVLRRSRWASILPIGLVTLSASALVFVLLPAYAPPHLFTSQEVAQQPGQTLNVRYGEVGRLTHLWLPHNDWPLPGGKLNLRLCWEPLQRDVRSLLVLVQIVGAQNRVVASRRTWPGLGTYPTNIWEPGKSFCDPVQVKIDDVVPAPALYQVEVALLDPQTGARLPAYSPDGVTLTTNFVGQVKIAAKSPARPLSEHSLAQRLDDQFELIGYDLQPESVLPGERVTLRLYWRALRSSEHDYTVFVHVADGTGNNLTTADSPPQAGLYPTSFWDVGEVVVDEHVITLPAHARGQYPILVGMYSPEDGTRLPIREGVSPTEIQLPLLLTVHSD